MQFNISAKDEGSQGAYRQMTWQSEAEPEELVYTWTW